MKVSITAEIDSEFESKIDLISELNLDIERYFDSRSYGEGLENLIVHIICMKTIPGLEKFSEERPSKYYKLKKVRKLDGQIEELRGLFSFDIKFSESEYKSFKSMNIEEARSFIKSKIEKSLLEKTVDFEMIRKFSLNEFLSDISAWQNI